jgi:hypothetical protein
MPIIPMAGGTEGKLKIGGSGFSLAYAKSETLPLKIIRAKKIGAGLKQ